MSRAYAVSLAALITAIVFVCTSCSSDRRGREGRSENAVVTVTGTGACKTLTVEAAGASSPETVDAGIDPTQPATGYLIATPEVIWWHASGPVDGHGHVDFVADEGNGSYDIVADPVQKVRIAPGGSGLPAPGQQLHIRSLTLTWTVQYVPARPTEPPPTIGIRLRISPFPDGGMNRCLSYSCDPEHGPQTCPPLPEGTLCTDTNTCNGVETCDADGNCRAGTNVAQGTPCIDGNVCNGTESCNGSGVCAAGTPITCSSTDADGDGMPDDWEVAHGLDPTLTNAFEDADGDRYPNIFEYALGTLPNDPASYPAPTYVVNAGGGGTHTTVRAALTAANENPQNGAYQIIGIAPGVYRGPANLGDVVTSPLTGTLPSPSLLFIGLEGAEKTIIDGGKLYLGWTIRSNAVVSSLTFRNTLGALAVGIENDTPTKEVRFVDLLVRDNTSTTWRTAGVHVTVAEQVHVVGSTFLDNGGAPTTKQIYSQRGTLTLANTVVWATQTGTMVNVASGAALRTDYCLVKGQTLPGTGNLGGTVDPQIRSDARLKSSSPLRSAGGIVAQSRMDMELESRPSASPPDIGVDQFNDVDADGLPDAWEVKTFGNLTTIAGAGDNDSDGLTNIQEYDLETNPLDVDTDNDGINDNLELSLGLKPTVADADDLVVDQNGDGLIAILGAQLGYQPTLTDDDGDGLSNADELLMCTNPLRADTDGDGVPDGTDLLPLDPLISTVPPNSQDVTPPVITLTSPSNAQPQP